jgi:hypothetical protein
MKRVAFPEGTTAFLVSAAFCSAHRSNASGKTN